jgi:hypothetical protein
LLLVGTGLVAMRRVLLPGLEGAAFGVEGWMFLGPALVTLGSVLCWTAAAGDPRSASIEARAPVLLLQVGLGFLALPAATWVWHSATGTSASTYALTFAGFAFGVPGVALMLIGLVLWMWRRMRVRGGGGA